jgi:hypothetical protein
MSNAKKKLAETSATAVIDAASPVDPATPVIDEPHRFAMLGDDHASRTRNSMGIVAEALDDGWLAVTIYRAIVGKVKKTIDGAKFGNVEYNEQKTPKEVLSAHRRRHSECLSVVADAMLTINDGKYGVLDSSCKSFFHAVRYLAGFTGNVEGGMFGHEVAAFIIGINPPRTATQAAIIAAGKGLWTK